MLFQGWERKHRALYDHFTYEDNEWFIVFAKKAEQVEEVACADKSNDKKPEMSFEEIPFRPNYCRPTKCACPYGGDFIEFACEAESIFAIML